MKGSGAFKYLGTFVILLWFILTMYLFFIGYWFVGVFTMLIAYDATTDLMDHWSQELKKGGK